MTTRNRSWLPALFVSITLSTFLTSALAGPGVMIQPGRENTDAIKTSLDGNEFELLVQASGNGPNFFGYAPLIAVVTYKGAGVEGLTVGSFSLATNAQVLPPGGSALVLDTGNFFDQGGGRYYVSVRPFNNNWLVGTYNIVLKVDLRPEFEAGGMTIVVVKNE